MADWIKTAKIGDKVVCVDDRPLRRLGPCGLAHGRVYTISLVMETEGVTPDGEVIECVCFVLAEATHPQAFMGPEFEGYGAFRFRPVTPRKTDISFANEILRKASKPVKERV